MAFITDDVPDGGPAELAGEHRRLITWMNAHRVGVIQYLDRRMVDRNGRAALYYIEGLCTGHGQRFALVRGDDIYLVSVGRPIEAPVAGAPAGSVHEVSVPEFAAVPRGAIEDLLADGLRAYYEAHPYMKHMSFWLGDASRGFDWTTARWMVRPRKYSLLYWRTELAKRWHDFRAHRWPRIWGGTSSPLAAALALAAFAWTGGGWPMILAGAWLGLRLLQYDWDWRLGPWMLGLVKYRDPMGHLHALGRVMNPRPLAALKVRVECIQGEPMLRLVRVVNRSFLPVPYVSIGCYSLARLLAPGLVEFLRRQAPRRIIDTTELERHFPSMDAKWLWPGQSFASRHHLLPDFPVTTQAREVEALVTISRFVSGEPRSGPATFLLEVEESLS